MKQIAVLTIVAGAAFLAGAGVVAALQGRNAQSSSDRLPKSSTERLDQVAKDFGITPEQVTLLAHKELGEPVVLEGELVVGVERDAAGHAVAVRINTPKRSLEFNVVPGEGKPGMSYMGGDVASDVPFGSVKDIDGDARVDQIIIRHSLNDGPSTTLLIRIGDQFESATGMGEQRFKLLASGRVVKFDLASREWVEEK